MFLVSEYYNCYFIHFIRRFVDHRKVKPINGLDFIAYTTGRYHCTTIFQIMKAFLILVFILFVGISAQAQSTSDKVVLVSNSMEIEIGSKVEAITQNADEVARVYKFKNARIMKALSFKTKLDKSRLA